MPRPTPYRPQAKDMYWFAHGGLESSANQGQPPRSNTPGPAGDTEDESSENNSLNWKANQERIKANSEEPPLSMNSKASDQTDGSNHSANRMNSVDKRLAVEERRRQLQEAEQEKNDAILRKHAEREAALEARRNAQRSNISFAFGSVRPPNGEMDIVPVQVSSSHAAVQPRNEFFFGTNESVDGSEIHNSLSRKTFFPTSCLTGSGALVAGASNNLMTQSMTGSISTCRGRRKNDLTPTVPYDRIAAPRQSAPVRKRSVSMSRLDILAQPRRPYVEAQKANSTMSSSSSNKDAQHSPNRPLSSASEKAGGSKTHNTTIVLRRPRTAATVRKSRPVSIAGSVPDAKKPVRTSTPMRSNIRPQQQPDSPDMSVIASTASARGPRAKSISSTDRSRKSAPDSKQKSPSKMSTPPRTVAKSHSAKPSPAHKQSSTVPKQVTPKVSPVKKQPATKKLAAVPVAAAIEKESKTGKETPKRSASPARSASPDDDSLSDEKSSSKRIISEEEAKAALAEKRRLAREQAEREAELERQKLEELKRQEEERIRQEEEEQRKMEEEQLRLLEEHRKNEEEKLKKAIEEQERKEEEEKARREEETRLKAEQEKRAKEEAEKQRIELEEKLRKEEEERAERKKRLEKIMSRTRGKSSGTASPSGSGSGSDQPDSVESQHDLLSSELSSLESNAAGGEQYQADHTLMSQSVKQSSPAESLDVVNETLYLASQSLSSNDLMIPSSGNTSLDGSLPPIPSDHASLDSNQELGPSEIKTELQKDSADDDVTVSEERCDDVTPVASEESLLTTQILDPQITSVVPPAEITTVQDDTEDAALNENALLGEDLHSISKPEISQKPDHVGDSQTQLNEYYSQMESVIAQPELVQLEIYSKENEMSESKAVSAAGDVIESEEFCDKDHFSADFTETVADDCHKKTVVPEEEPYTDIQKIIDAELFHHNLATDVESVDDEYYKQVNEANDVDESKPGVTNMNETFEKNFNMAEPLATSSLEYQSAITTNPLLQQQIDVYGEASSNDNKNLHELEKVEKHLDAELISSTPLPEHSFAGSEALNANIETNFPLTSGSTEVMDEQTDFVSMANPFGSSYHNETELDGNKFSHSIITHEDALISYKEDEKALQESENLLYQNEKTIDLESKNNPFSSSENSDFKGSREINEELLSESSLQMATNGLEKPISIADEIAFHQLGSSIEQDTFEKNHLNEDVSVLSSALEHHEVQQVSTGSSEKFLREFVDSDALNQQSTRIDNPFDAVDTVFEANKPMNHSDVTEELIVSSLNYADDSEGSSLDSNLSQILNVHSETVTNSVAQDSAVQKVIGNGSTMSPDAVTDSGLMNHQDELRSTSEQIIPSNSLMKSNGYTINANDRIFDCRFESVDLKADTTPVISDDFNQDRPVNGKVDTNTTSTVVDNVDSVNSNKVASNPFLGASDSNPFAANPFQVHEEKTFTA